MESYRSEYERFFLRQVERFSRALEICSDGDDVSQPGFQGSLENHLPVPVELFHFKVGMTIDEHTQVFDF